MGNIRITSKTNLVRSTFRFTGRLGLVVPSVGMRAHPIKPDRSRISFGSSSVTMAPPRCATSSDVTLVRF